VKGVELRLSEVNDLFELQLALGVDIPPEVATAILGIMYAPIIGLPGELGCRFACIVSDDSGTWVISKSLQPFGLEVIDIICISSDGICSAKLFPIAPGEFFNYGKLQCEGPTLGDLVIGIRNTIRGLSAFLEEKMGKQK